MSKYQDDIGTWNHIGSVTPKINQWLTFPTQSDGGLATFRLKVICSQPERINSVCYIRSRYKTKNSNQVDRAIKIFPESHVNDLLLIELPIPQDLFDRSIYVRSIEIKKIGSFRSGIGIRDDVNYLIELDELWEY